MFSSLDFHYTRSVRLMDSHMPVPTDLAAIADRLIAAHDAATMLEPITSSAPDFTVTDGYAVLAEIEQRRRAQDRLHQPHDLAPLRRLAAALGARVGTHCAFCTRRCSVVIVALPGPAAHRAGGCFQAESAGAVNGRSVARALRGRMGRARI